MGFCPPTNWSGFCNHPNNINYITINFGDATHNNGQSEVRVQWFLTWCRMCGPLVVSWFGSPSNYHKPNSYWSHVHHLNYQNGGPTLYQHQNPMSFECHKDCNHNPISKSNGIQMFKCETEVHSVYNYICIYRYR